MDEVNWSESAYQSIVDELETLAHELRFEHVTCIPVSALYGDNVVDVSKNSPWYEGPTVLSALETSDAGSWTTTNHGARLPVQWVLRQPGGGRTYAGMLNGAPLSIGDTVTLLPANITTTITSLHLGGTSLDHATTGLSIDVDLKAETDAGRGDLMATEPLPTVVKEFNATICWFGENPLNVGQRLRLKHTTKVTPVRISTLSGVVDIATLVVDPATRLATNEIGLATLQTAEPLVVDDYRDNRVTGSFVLIDEVTNATVAAGMVGRASFL
jgi:sulfate adenylyltransferase subunit 1 (EFTu-like GTPase family)